MPDKDLADLSEEEQVAFLKAQPEGGQTDNSPPDDIEQPPQDPGWMPDPSLLIADA